jgi:hypothetical protein
VLHGTTGWCIEVNNAQSGPEAGKFSTYVWQARGFAICFSLRSLNERDPALKPGLDARMVTVYSPIDRPTKRPRSFADIVRLPPIGRYIWRNRPALGVCPGDSIIWVYALGRVCISQPAAYVTRSTLEDLGDVTLYWGEGEHPTAMWFANSSRQPDGQHQCTPGRVIRVIGGGGISVKIKLISRHECLDWTRENPTYFQLFCSF